MTAIEIVNAAISRCGCNVITTLDDNVAEARVLKANFAACRDYVLENREWTFAKTRFALNQDPNAPAFGYTYQYILPSGILRVVRLWQDWAATLKMEGWVREGQRVLTNDTGISGTIYAEVLVRVDEGLFSPGMVQALIEYLISQVAVPLTENRQLAKDAADAYLVKVSDAAAMDGSQGRSQQLTPPRLPGRHR